MLKRSSLIMPFAPVERLMKENTSLRISHNAVETVTKEMIFIGKKIGERAWLIAQNTGRKTITGKDIELAYEQLYK